MTKASVTALFDAIFTIALGFIAQAVGPDWYPLIAAVVVAVQALVLALVVYWFKLELMALAAQIALLRATMRK